MSSSIRARARQPALVNSWRCRYAWQASGFPRTLPVNSGICPPSFANVSLLPRETYIGEIGSRVPHSLFDVGRYTVVDGDRVRAEDVDRFLRKVTYTDRRVKSLIPTTYLELSPASALRRYQRVASAQAILLLLFSVPILGLVLYFIVLVADSTVKRQQIEISILKSRGATTGQVFSIYLLQRATLAIVALAIGPQLGRMVARLVGGTRYFMTFDAQTPLQIETTTTSLTYTYVAIACALFATVLPAMGAARLAIVEAKQEVSRRQRRSFWERSYLEFLLLAIASYGYYLLKTQGHLADALNSIGDYCRQIGLATGLHPHTGTAIETREEIETILALVDAALIGFAPDTGQIAEGGSDILEVIRTYRHRIVHVHLKDWNGSYARDADGKEINSSVYVNYEPVGSGFLPMPEIFAILSARRRL